MGLALRSVLVRRDAKQRGGERVCYDDVLIARR